MGEYLQSEVGEELQVVNTQGQSVANKPNPRFKNYSDVFKNLVKSSNVPTLYPIMSMIISQDSTRGVTVTKKDDSEYWVKQYDLESYELRFSEKIGGNPDDYIKLKEVEQDYRGKRYAVIYNNDGRFYARIFAKETREE